MSKLLEIKNLTTRFYTEDGVVHAVNGISYELEEGETVGIVGESGSGKSVSMLSVMRLVPRASAKIEAGEVHFLGRDLLQLDDKAMEEVRGSEVAMIFQDPMTSLNPVLTVGRQITEVLETKIGLNTSQAQDRAAELLDLVGIPNARARLDDHPHQFSGGMRQRVMIAMALAGNPSLLIADEPTTALDVTIQAQLVALMRQLQEKLGMTLIWITHDLGVVARLAKRVIVMYAGNVIEDADVKTLFSSPRHPYTLGLLGSLPRLEQTAESELADIPGQPPNMLHPPPGCPFAPRCAYAVAQCEQEKPPLEQIAPNHYVACWQREETKGVWHLEE